MWAICQPSEGDGETLYLVKQLSETQPILHPSIPVIDVPEATEIGWVIDASGVRQSANPFVRPVTSRKIAPSRPAPPPPDPTPQPLTISRTGFMMLFTPLERIALRQAADPAHTSHDPIIADSYAVLMDAEAVNLEAGSVTTLVDYLVGKSILTVERATTIKAGEEPTAEEIQSQLDAQAQPAP